MRDNSRLRAAAVEALWRNPLVGLAVYDPEQGVLKDANNAFLDLLDSRFRTKKTLGAPIEHFFPEFDLSGLREVFQRVLASGVGFHAENLRLTRSQLGATNIACSVLPMFQVAAGAASVAAAGGGQAPGAAAMGAGNAAVAAGAAGGHAGAAGGEEPTEYRALLLVATEHKAQLPAPEQMSLLDNHTRHALGLQYRLSAREIDIVSECLQGKKNRQIAQDLHIGISTVKRHLESAYRKMGITSSRSLPLSILRVVQRMGQAPAEIDLGAVAGSGRSQAAA